MYFLAQYLVISTIFLFSQYFHHVGASRQVTALYKRSSATAGKDCGISIILDDFYLGSFVRRDRQSALWMAKNEINDVMREVNSIFTNEFQVGLPVVNIIPLNTGYSTPRNLMHTSRNVNDLAKNAAYSNKYGSGVFSQTKNSCAVLLITYQNFGSKLGSAYGEYRGRGTNGGICDRGGFNIGTVTAYFNGARLSREMFISTVAHEIGHMFGAPHDGHVPYPPYGTGNLPQCTPFRDKFIMNSVVKPGRNSRRFSVCSKWSIETKLNYYSSCFSRRGSLPYKQYGQSYR